MSEAILMRRTVDTVTLTLNRPPLNILDIPAINMLSAFVEGVAVDSSVRFLVFESSMDGVFSAGNDVADHTVDRAPKLLELFHRIFKSLLASDVVTVSRVDGTCLGGGAELALFCDFVCASDRSQFGFPEIKLGCFPPVAVAVLPVWVGLPRARRWILSGSVIRLAELQQAGLLHCCVRHDQLHQIVGETLSNLQGMSPEVLRMTRRALSADGGLDLLTRLRQAEEAYLNQILKTADASEGIAAFLDKRPPTWKST